MATLQGREGCEPEPGPGNLGPNGGLRIESTGKGSPGP